MIVPKATKDIIDEGIKLSHCVASYIDRIIRKECMIVFLREDVEENLITVEIKKECITQAKGYLNRNLTEQESKWLNIYAKAKNLKIKGAI